MEEYLGLRFRIPARMEEALPELLSSWPILGTMIEPGESGSLSVVAYSSDLDRATLAEIASQLSKIGAAGFSVEEVEAQDWLAGYREQAKAFPIGQRWWIEPSPDSRAGAPEGRQRLVIEPRMAFGSGSHESTQLMLVALEETAVEGLDVLDVGTGSGILALAAVHLGAHRVIGLDIDPTAIWVARQIASQQEWTPDITWIAGPISCLVQTPFSLILCNMISANFTPLLGDFRRRLGERARILLSGILVSEENVVGDLLATAGFAIERRRVLNEWMCLTAVAST